MSIELVLGSEVGTTISSVRPPQDPFKPSQGKPPFTEATSLRMAQLYTAITGRFAPGARREKAVLPSPSIIKKLGGGPAFAEQPEAAKVREIAGRIALAHEEQGRAPVLDAKTLEVLHRLMISLAKKQLDVRMLARDSAQK